MPRFPLKKLSEKRLPIREFKMPNCDSSFIEMAGISLSIGSSAAKAEMENNKENVSK